MQTRIKFEYDYSKWNDQQTITSLFYRSMFVRFFTFISQQLLVLNELAVIFLNRTTENMLKYRCDHLYIQVDYCLKQSGWQSSVCIPDSCTSEKKKKEMTELKQIGFALKTYVLLCSLGLSINFTIVWFSCVFFHHVVLLFFNSSYQ